MDNIGFPGFPRLRVDKEIDLGLYHDFLSPVEPSYLRKRRRVYLEGVFALETYPETEDEITPTYFEEHIQLKDTAVKWMKQEVKALLLKFDWMSIPLYRAVNYEMTRSCILSGEFESSISDCLGVELTRHFQHEFSCFCASKLSLQEYDRVVRYNWKRDSLDQIETGLSILDAVDHRIPFKSKKFKEFATRALPIVNNAGRRNPGENIDREPTSFLENSIFASNYITAPRFYFYNDNLLGSLSVEPYDRGFQYVCEGFMGSNAERRPIPDINPSSSSYRNNDHNGNTGRSTQQQSTEFTHAGNAECIAGVDYSSKTRNDLTNTDSNAVAHSDISSDASLDSIDVSNGDDGTANNGNTGRNTRQQSTDFTYASCSKCTRKGNDSSETRNDLTNPDLNSKANSDLSTDAGSNSLGPIDVRDGKDNYIDVTGDDSGDGNAYVYEIKNTQKELSDARKWMESNRKKYVAEYTASLMDEASQAQIQLQERRPTSRNIKMRYERLHNPTRTRFIVMHKP